MTSFCRSLALSLALGAMLLRAALPAGWMPNPAPDANVLLVICTPNGLEHVAPGRDRIPAPDRGNQVCPFAAAAHLSPPQIFAAVLPPASRPALRAAPLRLSASGDGPDHAAHGPRAPPASV